MKGLSALHNVTDTPFHSQGDDLLPDFTLQGYSQEDYHNLQYPKTKMNASFKFRYTSQLNHKYTNLYIRSLST